MRESCNLRCKCRNSRSKTYTVLHEFVSIRLTIIKVSSGPRILDKLVGIGTSYGLSSVPSKIVYKARLNSPLETGMAATTPRRSIEQRKRIARSTIVTGNNDV